ncbi:MAG: segregation/condensation protein A [Desulfosalsimonadaceae bacterium]
MTDSPYQIQLSDIFEGPMDLLVHLIKKNEVDIYDIPIAFITDQFLAYLEWIKSLDIDIAGDFLVMAATLTHIKSRMLLPCRSSDPEAEEDEDPRSEITGPLLEYLQAKTIADQLACQPMLNVDVFARKAGPHDICPEDPSQQGIEADLTDLMRVYQSLMENLAASQKLRVTLEPVSVKEKMKEVLEKIRQRGRCPFESLISDYPDRMEVIVTFLAILEIVKRNLGRLDQAGPHESPHLVYCGRDKALTGS